MPQVQSIDFDTVFPEFIQLTDRYAMKQTLPTTIAAAIEEVHMVMRDIEWHQHEGRAPDHHEIVWQIGYLIFCGYLVERVGQQDDTMHMRALLVQFLDHMGVALSCALEIGLIRLRWLNSLKNSEEIEHIDTHVLVPIMKRSLHTRS
jgi:hypothetical protein